MFPFKPKKETVPAPGPDPVRPVLRIPPVKRLREVSADFTGDPEVVRHMAAVIRALMRQK